MSEPAKDEAELLDAMVDAIWDHLMPETRWTAKPYVERDLRAAIRKAGWAVVPVEPTGEMLRAADRAAELPVEPTEEMLCAADFSPAPAWEMDDPDHAKFVLFGLRRAEWAAMLAAAPGVKP